MKRMLLLIFVFIVLCLVAVYAFIPAHLTISNIAKANTIQKNIADCLRDDNAWRKWWPGHASANVFIYDNCTFKLLQPFTDGAQVQLNNGGDSFATRIFVVEVGKDSSLVEWQTLLPATNNPFLRISHWLKSTRIKNNVHLVLSSLTNFASKTENMYGFPIVRTTFTDTILAATKFSTTIYPTTDQIYSAIEKLREKINDEGATEKDFPMLNVRQIDSNQFETMIAICVNKLIKNDGNIFVTRMVPMKDRFLTTEVTGGPTAIRNAHVAVKNFMDDHFLSAPAIPFEILVTDRHQETDTSKWRTIIFHPSM
jgi:hypothetical protein